MKAMLDAALVQTEPVKRYSFAGKLQRPRPHDSPSLPMPLSECMGFSWPLSRPLSVKTPPALLFRLFLPHFHLLVCMGYSRILTFNLNVLSSYRITFNFR